MRSRSTDDLITTRRAVLARMKSQSIVPKHQILDNKISQAYKEEIFLTDMTYQLVPPNNHRRNIAEKAIQNWKDHFVSVLSVTAATFLRHLWFQVIPQVERQLLLLRQSNMFPKISAYSHVYRAHDYNAAPFVPSVWNLLSTTSPTGARPSLSTAARATSSAPPLNTTAHGSSG